MSVATEPGTPLRAAVARANNTDGVFTPACSSPHPTALASPPFVPLEVSTEEIQRRKAQCIADKVLTPSHSESCPTPSSGCAVPPRVPALPVVSNVPSGAVSDSDSASSSAHSQPSTFEAGSDAESESESEPEDPSWVFECVHPLGVPAAVTSELPTVGATVGSLPSSESDGSGGGERSSDSDDDDDDDDDDDSARGKHTTHVCDWCHTTFPSRLELRSHLTECGRRLDHIRSKRTCKVCGTQFDKARECISHERTHPAGVKASEGRYICWGCFQEFPTEVGASKHMVNCKCVTSGVTIHCKLCGGDRTVLRVRAAAHVKGHFQTFVCEEPGCVHEFVAESSLRRHMVRTHGVSLPRKRARKGCSV